MNATTTLQKALAAQVALPLAQLPETAGHCPAWIDSKGAECRRPATDGLLCRRHHHVAERRLTAAIEKRQAEAVKATEKAPARRARLAEIEERIALLQSRLSHPDTTDMAAYGGAVNTRIQARACAGSHIRRWSSAHGPRVRWWRGRCGWRRPSWRAWAR